MKEVQEIQTILRPMLSELEQQRSQTSLANLKPLDELKAIMMRYSPSEQYSGASTEQRFFDNSPTLAELRRDYGQQAAQVWLVPQLTDLVVFSNSKSVLSAEQLKMCAAMIVSEYYYLKLSELIFFFYKMKTGAYGNYYGTISPMDIMASLRHFIDYRNSVYDAHEKELAQQKAEQDRKNAISYEEYLRRKKAEEKSLTIKSKQQ